MRSLAGSGAAFLLDVAEKALALAVAVSDAHERAVTLEWYSRSRLNRLTASQAATPAAPPTAPAPTTPAPSTAPEAFPAAYDELFNLCLKSDELELTAEALAIRAAVQDIGGQGARAIEMYNDAIRIAERAGSQTKVAQVAYRAARAASGTASIPTAVRFDFATRAIEAAKKADSPRELADALHVRSQMPIGPTHQSLQDLQEAVAAAGRYTERSGDPAQELFCLRFLALEYDLRGEYQAAVDTNVRRARLVQEVWRRPRSYQTEIECSQAIVKLYAAKMGEPSLALEAADETRKLIDASVFATDRPTPATAMSLAAAYRTLGNMAADLGQPVEAFRYWEQALAKNAEAGAQSTPTALVERHFMLTRRAEEQTKLGDYEAALKDWDELYTLIKPTLKNFRGSESYQRAQWMAHVAWTHALAGNRKRALELARDATEELKRDTSGRWFLLPELNQVIDVLLLTGNAEEAIAFCNFTHEPVRRESISQPVAERLFLENLARSYVKAGQFESARAALQRAIDIDRGNPTAAVGGLGGSLLAMGRLELEAGNYAKAKEHLLAARAAVNPYDQDRIWQIERALALALVRLGDTVSAGSHFENALTVFESVRERLRPEEFRVVYGFDRSRVYEDYADLLAAKAARSGRLAEAEAAFAAAERKRTQILWGLLATGWSRISPEARPDQIRRSLDLEARIGAKQALLAGQFNLPAEKRDANLVETLRRDLTRTQDEHAKLLSAIAQGQYRYAAPTVLAASLSSPVRAALAPSRALIEYLVTDERSYAFVVSRSGVKVVPLAIGRAELRKQVLQLLAPFRRLRTGEVDLARLEYDTGAAYALYRAIFAPIQSTLGTPANVVIVPDDVLHFLPFDALVEKAPQSTPRGPVLHAEYSGQPFLLRRYAISYLTSSASLLSSVAGADSRQAPPGQFFAMANPTAGRVMPEQAQDDPLKRQLRSGALDAFLTPLPGAEAEVQRISRYFARDTSTIVRGAKATEAAYDEQAGRFGIVHFATHALAADGQPLYSTLILAPDSAAGHDGFLQAYEVLRTPLQANLVVLSGCETAMGSEDWGQGLVGLVAAFQQAGARSVLATLWSIDETTADVMEPFYRAMAAGKTSAAALREAKLQMLQRKVRMGKAEVSLAHPFFWAPFILVGTPAGR